LNLAHKGHEKRLIPWLSWIWICAIFKAVATETWFRIRYNWSSENRRGVTTNAPCDDPSGGQQQLRLVKFWSETQTVSHIDDMAIFGQAIN
jgi:hypothetical protein